MARMGCSETAAHVLGRGMCHRADTERALCATVGGDSRAVIGKRDDKTRGDCLGACVCVCVCVWVQRRWQAGAPHAAPKPSPGTQNAKELRYSY